MAMDLDEHNVGLVQGVGSVDELNKKFYGQFPYPGPPITFPRLIDPDFERIMLNQALGDFSCRTVPVNARIWVAGCGTNQAVYTALRFPQAEILGSDLSRSSLEIARTNAEKLGINNLTLREESLNFVEYREQFDYVICTGVIHHNADPSIPLRRLAQALSPRGVIEIMVYNLFHRLQATSLQKAVRTLTRSNDKNT